MFETSQAPARSEVALSAVTTKKKKTSWTTGKDSGLAPEPVWM
jgi:hypothetical protein